MPELREWIACYANVLNTAECRGLVELAETLQFEPAVEEGARTGSHGYQLAAGRNQDRAALHDTNIAGLIWTRIARRVTAEARERGISPAPLGLNERLRFYRYDPGQEFPPHTDGFYRREDGARSLLTLLLYLNEDFEGGATVFCDTNQLITPRTGTALIFAHDLLHAGEAVTHGRKYVLRTDILFAGQGKNHRNHSGVNKSDARE